VRRNLSHFIPASCPEALRRAVRRNYVAFCLYLYESFRLDRLPASFFLPPHLALVDPWGVFRQKPLTQAAILVSVHSNWELIPGALHHLGLTSTLEAVVLGSNDQRLDALFDRLRSSVGVHSLLLDRAPLGSLRALKRGQVVILLGDRDYTGHGLTIPFAGERMSIPIGPAALAVQTGAPIVPLYLARHGHARFSLMVGRPIAAETGPAKNQQVERLTCQLADAMTRFIASAPVQWVAFHDAWKGGRPPNPTP
jgi:lauroyl/myristoyl acyltransferase